MNPGYARDLDLNLLRVFVVIADSGSVTTAAARLYLTQPAVSAALRRLTTTLGAPLFVRAGRGLALTDRGRRLYTAARPHLEGLLEAALSPSVFDPRTSERTVKIGLSDASESWLLPALLKELQRSAPALRLIVIPVQFRTVAEALTSAAVDLAVTVADELPAGTQRLELFTGHFVCLYDPRHVRLGKRPSKERYLAEDHVVVSYNGDLRGIVEDLLGAQRRVRLSVPRFHAVGSVVDGSRLIATVPNVVAKEITRLRPRLRTAAFPFAMPGAPIELLWRKAVDDDEAVAFVRQVVIRVGKRTG